MRFEASQAITLPPRGSGRLAIVRAKFGECFHVANVGEPADLDEGLRDLLTEAYDEAAG